MAKKGKRYSLVVYTRTLDRWWPLLFCIGLATALLAWPVYQDLYTRLTEPWRWMTLASLGAGVVLVSVLMMLLRRSAYVQPLGDHLRLVTPLFRLNISYRRILQTTTSTMATLFPPRSLSGLRRDIVAPLWSLTAVVVQMSALPLSAFTLRLFLSPFFFKDRTPHLVILVNDWMGFSTELDSLRVGRELPSPTRAQAAQSILSKLPRK